METILFLLPPVISCLILVGIHTYLGLHVLEREIIFIDLAMAQLAALGGSVGLLLGIAFGKIESQLMSIAFTTIGAVFFVWLSRVKSKNIPQEALIGVVYIFGSALMVLVLNKVTHGAESIKNILAGSILWNTWEDVYLNGSIYSVIALLFLKLHPHLKKNESFNQAKKKWIDLVFYILFGIVITYSVKTGGILLVFTMLVVPALFSALFSENFKHRLIIGWVYGFCASLGGLYLSFYFDLPAGAVIVSIFVILFLMTIIGKRIFFQIHF